MADREKPILVESAVLRAGQWVRDDQSMTQAQIQEYANELETIEYRREEDLKLAYRVCLIAGGLMLAGLAGIAALKKARRHSGIKHKMSPMRSARTPAAHRR